MLSIAGGDVEMYKPKSIIDIVAGNVRKTRSPFGIPKFMANTWWKTAPVKRQGDALLFTGMMYQLVPYIEKSTTYLERFEDTRWAGCLTYARFFPKYLAGMGLAVMTPGKGKRAAGIVLKNIVKILNKSRVSFKYRSELDHYSGILLYDLGDQGGFVEHAKFVAGKLQRAGIKKIITVDPHTTYALKVLYPKYTGIHFEVKTYFELATLSGGNGKQSVTLHDPCFYGRYLALSDVPRRLLASLNIDCINPLNSGPFTSCCGGPAESISPKLSNEVGHRRREELESTKETIISMCPICIGNLQKAGARVEDLSTVLARYAE